MLKQRIAAMIAHCQMQLKTYGEPMIDKSHTLLRIVTNFTNSYTSAIDGTSNRIETNEL